MTFYAESAQMTDLLASLRSDLPPLYEALPGFRGLLVLEKAEARNHVVALTLWKDLDSLAASEATAHGFADRIAEATGTAVSRNIYSVLGQIGFEGREPS